MANDLYENSPSNAIELRQQVTSLQRELAEARRELLLAREGCQLAIDNMHSDDEQDIAMTIHTLEEILSAPAPSDVKGEEVKHGEA